MILPMIWHSCIHSITPCAIFTYLAFHVYLCVCPSIDSNENNRFTLIIEAIHNLYCVPILLGHHSHEIWIKNTFFGKDPIQFPSHNTLNCYVFWLHVTHYNCHHFIVKWIIHVASWGHLSNTLDIIKHEPTCFKFAPRLHLSPNHDHYHLPL
jgi:hypothetical protein